jgi:hypothetical protein
MSEGFEVRAVDIGARVRGRPHWEVRVADAFDPTMPVQAHIAVMREPYLSYVLAGRKSIESRFTRVQAPPYGRVRADDVLLLKQVAGPVTALATVVAADFYVLDPPTFQRLRDRFAAALCASDPQFWDERRDARFATLLRLGEVLPIAPLAVDKRDRRGWVVLAGRGPHRDQLGFELGDPAPAPRRLIAEHDNDETTDELPAEQLQLSLEEVRM